MKRNNTDSPQQIIRAALYARVSTEEQVAHGYSLEAQEDALVSYANAQGYKIIRIYRDEGFSARKPVMKRKVMQELLRDIEAGKIDLVLFTKLDRWFRSVGEYHKVQTILDKYHVVWRAILEDYQTETADGRLKVNIMLSVAENEADRTSERIRFVFNNKLKKGEYCYGGSYTPFGYKAQIIDGKRVLVKDPDTQEAAQYFWDRLMACRNARTAGRETNLRYGLNRAHKSWQATVRNEVSSGYFHGVAGFCPAYINREDWEGLQHPERRIKSTQGGRVYLFVGLIHCPVCGRTLKANYKTYPNDRSIEYYGYRCNGHHLGLCTYGRALSERKLEKALVHGLAGYLEAYSVKVSASSAGTKQDQQHGKGKKIDAAKLKEQLRRLNKIYIAGNMDDTDYAQQAAELRKAIDEAERAELQAQQPNQPIDLQGIRNIVSGDFENQYAALSRQDRQEFWHTIIDEIILDDNQIAEVIFLA